MMKKRYDYNLGPVLRGEDAKEFDRYMMGSWDTKKGRETGRIARQILEKELL